MNEEYPPIVINFSPEGFKPVKLLALYSANLLIQPVQANDKYAGWTMEEYAENGKTFNLNGSDLADIAEIFGLPTYDLEIEGKNDHPGRIRGLRQIIFPILSQQLVKQEDIGEQPQKLYARETPESLKIIAVYEDGTSCHSSYRGSYDLHWDEIIKED
jgi:hypothetical protein